MSIHDQIMSKGPLHHAIKALGDEQSVLIKAGQFQVRVDAILGAETEEPQFDADSGEETSLMRRVVHLPAKEMEQKGMPIIPHRCFVEIEGNRYAYDSAQYTATYIKLTVARQPLISMNQIESKSGTV